MQKLQMISLEVPRYKFDLLHRWYELPNRSQYPKHSSYPNLEDVGDKNANKNVNISIVIINSSRNNNNNNNNNDKNNSNNILIIIVIIIIIIIKFHCFSLGNISKIGERTILQQI